MLGYFKSPEFQRVVLILGMTVAHSFWRRLINQEIPLPYLDEVFHIPQSQAFYTGDWTNWDSKITTPPGLYVFAYYVNSFRNYMDPTMNMAPPDEWRYINAVLFYLLLIALYVLAAVGSRSVQVDRVLQREFAIVMFPLLFFFSGLFYTDILGVFAVVVTHVVWTAASGLLGRTGTRWRRQIFMVLHVLLGLLALSARQTNIFWVSVYLAGLQVVETVKDRTGVDKIHDPPIAQASVKGESTNHTPHCPVLLVLTFAYRLLHHNCVACSSCNTDLTPNHTRYLATACPFGIICCLCLLEWWCCSRRQNQPRRNYPSLADVVHLAVDRVLLLAYHVTFVCRPFQSPSPATSIHHPHGIHSPRLTHRPF